MKVVVAGGTGWLGSAFCRSLALDGHEALVLSRTGYSRYGPIMGRVALWDGRSLGPWVSEIEGADAVVNFAGESLAARRWSPERKRVLVESRVRPTETLVSAIEAARRRPAVLINSSAVGYYGDRGDGEVTEEDPPGSDFLAGLCTQWEQAARGPESLGVRVVLMRTGVVLGPRGGALPKLALPFRLFLGGPIGSGRQWMPWVHIEDVVGLFRFALERAEVIGPMNGTAPDPVTMQIFARTLGQALNRPSWMPVPWLALRLAVGELADALVTGQRALPALARRLGYEFREPDLLQALHRSLGQER